MFSKMQIRPIIYTINFVIIFFLSLNLVLAQEEAEEKKPAPHKNSPRNEQVVPSKKIPGPNLYNTVRNLAKAERLTVIFDKNALAIAESTPIDNQLSDLSPLSAITTLLEAAQLTYSQMDRRAIIITPKISFYNPTISLEEIIRKANKYDEVASKARLAQKVFKLYDYDFKEASLSTIIQTIATHERLNVIYEDTIAKLIETKKVNFTVKGVSAPNALSMLLESQRFVYVQVGERTIMLRVSALANYKPSPALETIITRADENQALGID